VGARQHFLEGAFSILKAGLKGGLGQLDKKYRPRFLSPGKPERAGYLAEEFHLFRPFSFGSDNAVWSIAGNEKRRQARL
jgi:hypothetical protein